MHSAKRVLNSLSVDAGAATPETHKKTPIGQKNSEAYLHIKSMVQPGMHCVKWVLHLPPVDAGAARQKTHKTTPIGQKRKAALRIKAWCILRMHCVKWVLHLRSVDAGAARQKNTKKTPIFHKYPEATLHIKSMVHPEGALGKKGATLTACWRRRGHTRNTHKNTNGSEK